MRYSLLSAGETVVVAVSGGPDSTVLLHLLASLRDEWGVTLVAAHLNHGFRGAESDGDADYVSDLCRSLAVPCVVETADVPAIARRRHLSAQEAAREVRHAFLKRTAAECNAARIAVGHTRDDRVESILLNLLRGTGPDGLAGFPPLDMPLIRPLYEATRGQVLDYCDRHGLHPRHDSSNAKTDYLRNRTRAELLPYLRSYYNGKVDVALFRAAELITADNEVLEELAAAFLTEAGQTKAGQSVANNVVLERKRLLALPVALQRRVLRQAIAGVRGHLQGVTYDAIQGAIAALAGAERFSATLPITADGNTIVMCDADGMTVCLVPPPSSPVPWEKMLAVPGMTELVRSSLCMKVVFCPEGSPVESFLKAATIRDSIAYGDVQVLVFRADEVMLPLRARSWRPGDRIRLRRNGGSKKLQDLFVDRKIPLADRSRRAVIAAADGTILAIPGVAESGLAVPRLEWSRPQADHSVPSLLALIAYPLSAAMCHAAEA
jgi:tRNA(Ile)-lysidine synthase